VLSLLGSKAPASLKIFLAALAIIDDLGAILIIAFFYTSDLTLWALAGAGGATAVLIALNALKVKRLWPYLLIGAALWFLLLKSGVHATLAGVVLALTIPLAPSPATPEAEGPLHRLEHGLNPWVAYLIVPVFGFANAGVALGAAGLAAMTAPASVGVAAGLFFGKPLGVFLFSLAAIGLGAARRPSGTGWLHLFGVSVLCGIGFTMSLFINNLAFADPLLREEVKVGVLAGSVLSAVAGWIIFSLASTPRPAQTDDQAP
jgi:NhaA family Na+:H+ antiporter